MVAQMATAITLAVFLERCYAYNGVWKRVAVLPPSNPPWPPTYNMSLSTITMQCNFSGWSSPERGSQFGIVSYDWSNAKRQWAAQKPMDCEERLQTQAQLTKTQNPASHVFVYRNLVKALPWFSSVREKLDDPNYSGFFLKFDPNAKPYAVPQCAPEDPNKCTLYYHDQEQTPEVPTKKVPEPDGTCTEGVCDCGVNPCGEYLFDHRNGSMLRNWILNELVLGPTAIGDKNIDGLFMDDYWCSNLICEEDPTVHGSWNQTMTAVEESILQHKAYTWSLIPGEDNANASPLELTKDTCLPLLREACNVKSRWQNGPVLFGVGHNGTNLTQLHQDLAFFLLARGPYAWLGWGTWGMTWPFNPEPRHGELPPLPHGVPRPSELDMDYGEPEGLCFEISAGVFHRQWSKVKIALNCTSFESMFEWL
ncbi:hypothetical protein AAMO2058_000824700 [Amorphochlora amoebiformis]